MKLDFDNMKKQDIFDVDLSKISCKDYIEEEINKGTDGILDNIMSEYNAQFPIGGCIEKDYEFKISAEHLDWLIRCAKKLQGIKDILKDTI